MIEPEHSIMPLLRERRTELQRDALDFDHCAASNETWLRHLRHVPSFNHRVAEGAIVLANYAERQATEDAEATGATPEDFEPRG